MQDDAVLTTPSISRNNNDDGWRGSVFLGPHPSGY